MIKSENIQSTFLKDDSGRNIVEILTLLLSSQAKVHVIKILHEIGPEELAMVQALYSRSYAPIIQHLTEVVEKGGEKFMKQFYSGYGHKSIGDLASILICVEGVSMLAVKAIQDTQLYNGQEASTRYINFSTQPFMSYDINGVLTGIVGNLGCESDKCQDDLRQFYLELLPAVQQHLFEKYAHVYNPDADLSDPKTLTKAVFERTIKARSFDIVRGFLPAGATTSAAWYSSISHASDHLGWLRNHPLPEVKDIAQAIDALLSTAYPASFEGRNVYAEREEYKANYLGSNYYLKGDGGNYQSTSVKFFMDEDLLRNYRNEIYNRPKGQDLPVQIGECGVITYTDALDFGSFRDIQRHRAVVQRMGLLTFDIGFHEWYLENLPYDLRVKAEHFLTEHMGAVNALGYNELEKQYFIPMGFKVPIRLTGSLSKMVYMVELRAQKTVHPTLHDNAYHLGISIKEYLKESVPGTDEIPMYLDEEVGVFSLESSTTTKHRGSQTILKDGKEM